MRSGSAQGPRGLVSASPTAPSSRGQRLPLLSAPCSMPALLQAPARTTLKTHSRVRDKLRSCRRTESPLALGIPGERGRREAAGRGSLSRQTSWPPWRREDPRACSTASPAGAAGRHGNAAAPRGLGVTNALPAARGRFPRPAAPSLLALAEAPLTCTNLSHCPAGKVSPSRGPEEAG